MAISSRLWVISMANKEERRQQVHARRRKAEARKVETLRATVLAARNCLCGSGTADDLALMMGDVSEELAHYVPMVVIARTRRELGFGIGPRADHEKWCSFVADVLSFRPGEKLDAETRRGLAQLDEVIADPATDLLERWCALVARALIGPGDGSERRAWVWGTAEPERRARDELCEPWIPRHAGLIDCWPELTEVLQRGVVQPATTTPGRPAVNESETYYSAAEGTSADGEDWAHVTTFAGYAAAMRALAESRATLPEDVDGSQPRSDGA